jgi:GrpB-like predicted nucleotidyltransferase (UPF0157 family)
VSKTREIKVVAYRPEWAAEYREIVNVLQHTLGEVALRIDHIGSTSVSGLAAKDVIDVQVTVRVLTADLEPAFEGAGYRRRAEVTEDHRPPHAVGTEQDWQKQYYQPASGERRIHLHVRRAGSANGRYALFFRDYLRTHPLAAAAYAQAKQALARHAPTDWDLYYDVKDPVCDIIMAGAEDWAASTSWRTEHYS